MRAPDISRPNILLITSDQQHWMATGYNNPEVKTPNLDRLAASGMIFDRAYCPNPTCTPTRASILTGQYPSQHGAYSLGTKLDEGHPTLNDALRPAGYRTALVGKAHFQPLASSEQYPSLESQPLMRDLDFWRNYAGPFYGFEHFKLARNHGDEPHAGQHYAIWMEQKGLKNWRDYFQKTTGTREPQQHRWELPQEYHYNRWVAEQTNDLIATFAAAEDPFFLWSSYPDPHPPYLVPAPWDTMYDPAAITLPQGMEGEHDRNPVFHRFAVSGSNEPEEWGIRKRKYGLHGIQNHHRTEEELRKNIAVYYGMVSMMDDCIGQTLRCLDELGLTDKTLVVFTTDHGHYYGHHGLAAKGPFHYEDGVRVPLVAAWPGHIPAGKRSSALQSLVDLPVTFAAAAGLEKPPQMTGANQWPVWTGAEPSVREWCLVENNHEPGIVELRTYIEERYKLTVYRNLQEGELYDLQEDPGEFHNRFDDPAYLGIKAELMQRFLQADMAREVLPMPRVSGA